VDTLRIETTAGVVLAHGAFGLTPVVSDSLTYRVSIDSLGGLRRYFGTTVTQGVSVATTDSIDGSVVVAGRVGGSLDSLVVTGDVDAREMRALDMRGAGDVQHALGVQPAREAPGLLHRRGSVIQAGEEMGVEIHVSHSPMS